MFRKIPVCAFVMSLVTLLAHCAPVLGASGNQSAPFIWVESWRHGTHAPIQSAAAGDVDADGALDLAVLSGNVISVYAIHAEGPNMIGQIQLPSGAIISIAIADYDGDGAAEVWAGSDAPGVIAIYGFDGEDFHLKDQVRYVWDDVVRLLPFDLDGWGRIDLALITSGGELHVYRWNGAGLERAEFGNLRRGVRFAAVGDIDLDQRDEIVLARDQDHVVVLDWRIDEAASHAAAQERQSFAERIGRAAQTLGVADPIAFSEAHIDAYGPVFDTAQGALVPTWENFVWGGHTFLTVADFRGDPGDEVFLSTSRGLVHLFGAGTDGALGPQSAPQSRLVVPGQVVGTGDLDLDGSAELLVNVEHGIEAWDASPIRTALLLATAAQPVEFVHIVGSKGMMVTAGPWGFARYDRRDARYVRVVRNGAPIELMRDAVATADSIYLSAADWEALTGIRLRFDPVAGRLTGIRGFHFLIGDVAGADWIYDGRPVRLAHPPLVVGGELYLPIQFADVLGEVARWDPFGRTLLLDP